MKIHCIGIGGIGLSALAQLLKHQGHAVTGCDRSLSPVTDKLMSAGIMVAQGHDARHITEDLDLLVYSDAVPEDQSERVRARELGIEQKSYAEALGEIANESQCLIAVAGTHGKTSTTAMLIDVLEAGGLDPTAVVGSLRAKTKSNFKNGSDNYFVVEADEYLRHFLYFLPKVLVITNIDADHLDYYKDLADVQSAFRALVEKVPADGFIICDPNDPNVAPVLEERIKAKPFNKRLSLYPDGIVDYKKYYDTELPMKVLPLQRINAAAVLAVADILKIDQSVAKKALSEFTGTWRRFEFKGSTKDGALVYDDYAHHPKEISMTLASVREMFPEKKIIVAFQPHLYSRTKLLLSGFATAFKDADEVIVAPIFAAREEPDPAISSEILAQKITEHGTSARACDSLDDILLELKTKISNLKTKSLIITMGAGELYKIAEQLTK